MEPPVRSELQATLAARRELGPEHDDTLIDGFLERIAGRLEQRGPAPTPEEADDARGMQFVVTLVSLGVGIPISAIALSHGLVALAIAWIGIVLVNVVFARSAP